MATVTGLTAERMLEIEASSVVDAKIESGNLILIQHDGTEIPVGSVIGPSGPAGPTGPAGLSAIPGEVKLWPGSVLPDEATYGKWVWADGAYYPVATYPLAAAHIAAAWKTFDGASDPGPSNFRVPDLRGLVAAGLDQMPGGTRANRMARAVAITLAAKTGKETHILTVGELARHSHNVGDHNHGGKVAAAGSHGHTTSVTYDSSAFGTETGQRYGSAGTIVYGQNAVNPVGDHQHDIPMQGGLGTMIVGSDNAHENVQPTVMVPYIVCLDV